MARKRAAEAPGEPSPAETGSPPGKISKAIAVRAALADGADTPAEGVAYIKAKFGLDITPQHFSSYKSQQKAKAGKPAARRGRAEPVSPPPPSGLNGPAGLATSVEAIKVLVDRYGVDQVVSIARLFGK